MDKKLIFSIFLGILLTDIIQYKETDSGLTMKNMNFLSRIIIQAPRHSREEENRKVDEFIFRVEKWFKYVENLKKSVDYFNKEKKIIEKLGFEKAVPILDQMIEEIIGNDPK